MEVSEIAAIVSLNEVTLRQNIVLKPLSLKEAQEKKLKTRLKSELVFELVESAHFSGSSSVPNPLKPEAMFTASSSSSSSSSSMSSFLATDMFWKIHRSYGCQQVVHLLASVLYELVESSKVGNLVHKGEKIVNILVANTMAMDVSDIKHLEPTIIVPEKFNKTTNTGDRAVPLFSTYSDKRALYDAGLLVGIDLAASADHLDRDKEATFKHIQQSMQVDGDDLLPHWWLCLVTESRKMIHIDLCGPAYDILEYKENVLDVSSGEYCGVAPLHIFETDEYLLMEGEGDFSHKLVMQNVLWPSIVRSLPSGIRHLSSVQKGLPIQFTPLQTYLTRNDALSMGYEMQRKNISDFICNFHCLGKYLQSGAGIKVASTDKKALIGKVIARKANENKKIIITAMLQGISEAVTLTIESCSSSSVSLYPPPFASLKPFKSLEAIHADIQEAKMYSFSPQCRVVIHGLKSEGGMALNGCEAIVIRDALIKPPPYGETRWSVQLVKSKEIKSIAGKNLKLATSVSKGTNSKVDEKAVQNLLNDPLTKELLTHMRLGNSGFTVICDPKYRTVVKSLMDFELLPSDGMFEAALKIADHPKGEAFRQLMVRMKSSGVDPTELEDPDYANFMSILSTWGLFRPRS